MRNTETITGGCAGGYSIIFSILTHSISKNVNYGAHKAGAHPVESDGSVTVPAQTMLMLPLSNIDGQ